jgi:hypothetical protein
MEINMAKNGNKQIVPASDGEEIEQVMEGLEGVLYEFRDSIRAEADRPDFFWARQRNAILSILDRPDSAESRWKRIWIPAAAALLLCMLFFAEISEAPVPDLAAGYDQNLLIEVERALNRSHPDALAPALLIIEEMEQNKTAEKNP